VKWTVVWVPDAEGELIELWMASPDRAHLTRSAHEIDERLRHDSENEGESREEGFRILLVPPLGVKFEIKPDDRIVQVLTVWTFDDGH
jgi:hypothetical protein